MTNLRNFTTYNLAVSAITKSRQAPGKLYESQFSSYHQIFVSPGCEVRTELVSVFARSVLKILSTSKMFGSVRSSKSHNLRSFVGSYQPFLSVL